MGLFRRQPPLWAQMLTAQVAQVNQKLDNIDTGVNKIMTEDAAVEADVAAINTDVTALTALIASLQNVNVGDTITAQTKADLDAAVAALGGLVPPPPAPTPAP
jgi:ribosomal protein L2